MMYGVNLFLQGLESDFLTAFMKIVSDIITENPLCIIAVVIFWSVNKRSGIITALSIVSAVTINSALKLYFKIPRPFLKDPAIKKLDTTGGYSFPSGHSQQASGISTAAYVLSGRKRWVLISGIILTLLIMTSRMYLGMHSILDVTVGAALGIITALLSIWLFEKAEESGHFSLLYIISAVSAVCSVVYKFDRDLVVMTALSVGAVTGFLIEEKYISYSVPESLGKKIAASVIGLIVILAVKSLFIPVDTSVPAAAFLEYVIFGFAITAGAPYIIKKILLRKEHVR